MTERVAGVRLRLTAHVVDVKVEVHVVRGGGGLTEHVVAVRLVLTERVVKVELELELEVHVVASGFVD